MRDLLVQGMFRSGTTLLSRMLSARPENLLVTDPFVYFFKAYRNFQMERHAAGSWRPDEPTSDHFLSRYPEVDAAILCADLSETMPVAHLQRMIGDIRAWKTAQHPQLCGRLDELQQGTFAQVYRQLVRLCIELYGSPATEVAGTKLSWCEEYLPALGRAFPETHFVLLVRDLRSIVASQESRVGAGIGKRPLLFYIRHWRKSVAFAKAFSEHHSELRGRTHVVRYEDLVCQPRATLERLCSTSPLTFHESMLKPSTYRSASENGAWTPNSSFDAGEGIYQDSVDKWRAALNEDQVRTIETLAGPELTWMGYEVARKALDTPLNLMPLECEPPIDELAGWIRDFSCCDYLRDPSARKRELEHEALRRSVIEEAEPPSQELLEALFPASETLPDLRLSWARLRQLESST